MKSTRQRTGTIVSIFVLVALISLGGIGCSHPHWVTREMEQLDSAPRTAVVASFQDAVSKDASPLNEGREVTVDVTTEDPIILIDGARSFFELFSFRAEEARTFRLEIVSKEVEKKKLRGELTDTRELGVMIPAVYVLTRNGEVVTDALTSLEYEDDAVFKSPRFVATLEHALPEAGDYYVLVASHPERLGSEVKSELWSFATLDEMLSEDDLTRIASPTGKLKVRLAFLQ